MPGVIVIPCDPEEAYASLASRRRRFPIADQQRLRRFTAFAVSPPGCRTPPRLAQAIASRARQPAAGPSHESLSEREFGVPLALARGESLTAIATRSP